MNNIKRLNQSIESRWPRLESRLNRIVLVIAVVDVLAICVWLILKHYT